LFGSLGEGRAFEKRKEEGKIVPSLRRGGYLSSKSPNMGELKKCIGG
jgi:hypothetical protein